MFWKVSASLLVIFLAAASAGIPGGPIDANVDDQDVRDALQFAVAEHNRGTNDLYISNVMRVVKAQKQVVAGVKYIFNVVMARTSCRKGGVEKVCAIHSDPNIARAHQCKLAVWSQLWLGSIKLIENTCK